jgi:hypothetical protein
MVLICISLMTNNAVCLFMHYWSFVYLLPIFSWVVFVFSVLKTEPRALQMTGKCSTTHISPALDCLFMLSCKSSLKETLLSEFLYSTLTALSNIYQGSVETKVKISKIRNQSAQM